MSITKAQGVAMAAIVALGLLAGSALLINEPRRAGSASAQDGAPAGSGHGEAHEESHEASHGGGQHGGHPADHGKDHGAAGHEEEDHDEERLVKLTPEQVRQAGIAMQPAGPGPLQSAAEFNGEIRFNEDRTAHVVPRLPGVAEQVGVTLGQTVRRGQVLAVVASPSLSEQRSELLTAQRRREAAQVTLERERRLWQDRIAAEQDYLQAQTAWQEADIAVRNAEQKLAAVGATTATPGALSRHELRAPFDGTVVEKHLTLGEAVKDDAAVFTLSDLRSVWAEFNVAPQDLATVRVGQRAKVTTTAFASAAEGTVSYVGALLGEQTRTARARVTLTNPDGAWRPGLFVTVAVYGAAQTLPLAVSADAVQTIDGRTVVFRAVPEGFEAVPVTVGRSDGRVAEILSGLAAGDMVASRNTFVLKSELGKAGAAHEH